MKNKRGIFITFEGPDGSGKTTQINLLHNYLTARGYDCIQTREPGGTKVGEKLREILKNPDLNNSLSIITEVLLLQTSRAQHVHELINPSLDAGKIVLCDRFADSSTTYQGIGRGVGKNVICNLNDFSTGGLKPDITILLDLPPKSGLQRADEREHGQKKDRWEEQDIEFHQNVRNAFLELASENEKIYEVVSAIGSIEEVHKRIIKVIDKRLNSIIL